jgi:hypothetical protein
MTPINYEYYILKDYLVIDKIKDKGRGNVSDVRLILDNYSTPVPSKQQGEKKLLFRVPTLDTQFTIPRPVTTCYYYFLSTQ